ERSREGHTMANEGASNGDGPSLEQAQYEYRKTIYFAGLEILKTFSESVIGRDPSVSREAIPLESGDGARTEAQASVLPPPIALGPPPGWHIYGFGPPPPPPPPVTYGPPSGFHIYGFGPPPPPPPPPPVTDGPPSGFHIYSFAPLPPPPAATDGPPSGWHIYAVT